MTPAMKRRKRGIAAALLATAALLACSAAGARPHAPPPPWKDPAGPPTERDVWLKRLVGTYRIEGLVHVVAKGPCGQLPPDPAAPSDPPPPTYCESIKGMGDCVAVGTGPGVQCILQVLWNDMHEMVYPPAEDSGMFNLPGGVAHLAPAMILMGLDPGREAVNYLLVDNKGLPEGGLGFSKGSRVIFKSPCVNWPTLSNAMRPSRPPPRSCDRILRIDARPDANVVHLSMDIEIDEEPFTRYEMTLRRVSQGALSGTPPARRQRQ